VLPKPLEEHLVNIWWDSSRLEFDQNN
jgi:hypothetical protein